MLVASSAERAIRRTPSPPATESGAGVTAVLVCHDGAAWLPTALQALRRSTVTPGQVVFVDTGSTDGSAEVLQAAGPVLSLPAGTGYGAAVAAALQAVPWTPWLWLLHDDAAPDPEALELLLRRLLSDDDVAMVGPKSRDWYDERVLVEVGVTTDLSGHRHTGLDAHEWDQGQRDAERDVLAVGTAGALVRRAAWDAVGGLDPALPLYRDDLDLGWRFNAAGHRVVIVPAAGQRHVRAAMTGRRSAGAVARHAAQVDRRHAVHVLLAHAPRRALPLLLLVVLLSSLTRAARCALGRAPAAALHELLVPVRVLAPGGGLAAARRQRQSTSRRDLAELRPLLARRSERLRARAELGRLWLTERLRPAAVAPNPLRALGDPGPDGPDAADQLSAAVPGLLRLLLSQPAVALVLGLTAVCLLAERSLLRGGALSGGRLLPVPDGASNLWSAYLSSWQDAGVGTASPAHPAVGGLAALATGLGGRPGWALALLLLGAVPLAGLAAYLALRPVTDSRSRRLWAAGTWALLPVVTGGIAQGRVDVAAGHVALPLLLAGACNLLRREAPGDGLRRAGALGLGLAFAAAFNPLLWPALGALLVMGALLARAGRRLALLVLAVPALTVGPWALAATREAWLAGPGAVDESVPVPFWQLLLLQDPAAPGGGLGWLAAAALIAALAGLAVRSRPATVPWVVALAGYAVAVALNRSGHDASVGLQLAGAGVLWAAVLASRGWAERLGRTSFGWRQPTVVALVALAALTPVLAAAAWMSEGADGPLTRRATPALPAFAAAELAAQPGLRALVLRVDPADGAVRYGLGASGFGAADLPLADEQQRALDAVVADLVTDRGSPAAAALATRAVRYVALAPGPATTDRNRVVTALDRQDGLVRRSSDRTLLWRVVAPTARLSLVAGAAARAARTGQPTGPVPFTPVENDRVAAGPVGRLLVLSEAFDPGWTASYDGQRLAPVRAWGWAQAFELPPGAGRVEVVHGNGRSALLAVQALGLGLVLVLALVPAARRRGGLEPAPSTLSAAP